MREITRESVDALMCNRAFKKANMEVKIIGSTSHMLLHGNTIAMHRRVNGVSKFKISHCSWKSRTTKERLNAIPGVSIYQKDWDWFLNGIKWDGSLTLID